MPNLVSSDWYEHLGACVKHAIPETPCPACLAEQNPNIQVMLTEDDLFQLDWDPNLKIEDLFPKGQEWLVDRIM